MAAGLLLFPPWKTVFVGGWYSPKEWSEGFHFLLAPPSPSPNAYQYHSELHIRIDGVRLFSLLAIHAIIVFGIFWTFRLTDGELAIPLSSFLQKRRLSTATLLAFGIPLPPIGPVAYAVPSILLEGSHVWFGALLFEALSLFCLSALLYLLLFLLPKVFPRMSTYLVQPA